MDADEPRRPRYQLTIKDLALATAFFGLALGLWFVDRDNPIRATRFLFVFGAMTSFGAGVGSLFGRPLLGATVAFLLIPAAPILFVVLSALH